VEGFMTIPPPGPNAEASRPYFQKLTRLRERYSHFQTANINLRELSMGMTDDYQIAIEEGATIIRIGRAIFGERQ
jgi:PLP dependent protein